MRPLQILRADGAPLAGKAFCTESVAERVVGWLGKDGAEPGEGLLIGPCAAIHSFGMRFEMDAIFLDSRLRVTKVWPGLRPNRLAWAPLKYFIFTWRSQVLELPAGAARGIQVGETLRLSEPAA